MFLFSSLEAIFHKFVYVFIEGFFKKVWHDQICISGESLKQMDLKKKIRRLLVPSKSGSPLILLRQVAQATLSYKSKTYLECVWSVGPHILSSIWCLSKCLEHDRHWERTCWNNEDAVKGTKVSHSTQPLFWMTTWHFLLLPQTSTISSPRRCLSADGLASYLRT